MTGEQGPRVPAFADLDLRLAPAALSERERAAVLRTVESEHAAGASVGRCAKCRFPITAQRRCPSAVVARALRTRSPLPGWLSHLVVPGVPAARPTRSVEQRQAAEDAAEGLFPAPARRRKGQAA